MTRLLLALAIGSLIGCTGVYPVGPLAGSGIGSRPPKPKSNDKDDSAEPIVVPAVKPTPPLNTTGPEDVNPDDPHAALRKLKQELEADRNTIPTAPKTAEVSRYKGGVKQ